MTHGIQITGKTCHQITRAIGIVKDHILVLYFFKQCIPQTKHSRLGNLLISHACKIGKHRPKKSEAYHHNNQTNQDIPVIFQVVERIFSGQKLIHNLLGEERNYKLHKIIQNRTTNPCQIEKMVALHVFPQPLYFCFCRVHICFLPLRIL